MIFLVGDAWVVTVVELESSTGGYQNLEVKTEPQSPTIESGRPECWTTRSLRT